MSRTAHKVVTTENQLRAALRRARRFAAAERRVRSARYDRVRDRVVLELSDGMGLSIPRGYLQGLADAGASALSRIEILGQGTGLHWPRLDVQHYVPGLLNHVFGASRWMAQLGRLGGASTTPAKRAAARANGRKGGRPRTTRTA